MSSTNFSKFKKEQVILNQLIKKIKNILKLNIFSFKLIRNN